MKKKNRKLLAEKKMAAKFIENGILGTSRKCSKDGEKGGTSADRIPDARYPRKVERRPGRIPDVRHLGGMLAEKNSGCETSGWNGGREEFRV